MPPLFPGVGADRGDSGCDQVELVKVIVNYLEF